LKQGDSAKGRDFCGFDSVKPIIMIVGGSLGSVRINQVLRSILITPKKQIKQKLYSDRSNQAKVF
jgi:UDP-N-acetylglucosamine:LPS N-acetylglucosamine transferase